MTDPVEDLSQDIEAYLASYLSARVGEVTIQESLILEDLGLARYAFAGIRRDHDATLENVMFLRLISEVALRVRWIAADIERAPTTVLPRVDRLRKGDLIALREAYKAIHARIATATPLLEEFHAKIDEIAETAVPSGVANLVVTDDGNGIYATHRLCSAIVHAGSGAKRVGLLPKPRPFHMAVETLVIAVTWGAACLAALSGKYPDEWPEKFWHELLGRYAGLIEAGYLED